MRTASIFSGAILLTGAVWAMLWPTRSDKEPSAEPLPARIEKEAPWDKTRTDAALAALQTATTAEEKLQAALKLAEIPPAEIPALLGTVELSKDRRPSLVARTLLIRWVSSDGEAAMNWAWRRFRADPLWRDLFQDLGPAWAWQDPKGFAGWVLGRLEQRQGTDEVGLEEAVASDSPFFETEQLTMIAGWLMKDAPQEATKLLMKRNGFSSHDQRIWDVLDNPQSIQEALLAFDDLEPLKALSGTGKMTTGPMMYAETLLAKWKELDPVGFAKSSYAEFLPVRPWHEVNGTSVEWMTLPVEKREEAAYRIMREASGKARPPLAGTIVTDWSQSDPEACRKWLETLPEEDLAFAAGSFVKARAAERLDEMMVWMERFKPGLRDRCLVQAFDAWTAANPEGQPDMSAWTGDQRQAWKDFEALKAAGIP